MPTLKNRYKVEKIIGQGGMGKVYLALDLLENKYVAIKEIATTSKDFEVFRKRFEREYYFLSIIDHPNVVKAYDFFQEQQLSHMMVLEYIEGVLLKDFIKNELAKLNLMSKLAIAIQIARAVEVVNTAGVVHRDIKPSNIMLDQKLGLVKILDLGIAKSKTLELEKLTFADGPIGTPTYMSPEQVNGDVAENSDVFSIGIILYQIFSNIGHSPFAKNSSIATMEAICAENLPSLTHHIKPPPQEENTYTQLSEIVARAMEKNASNRTKSAGFLAVELENVYRRQQIGTLDKKPVWKPTQNLTQIQIKSLEKKIKFARKTAKKTTTAKIFFLAAILFVGALLFIHQANVFFVRSKAEQHFQSSLACLRTFEYKKAWLQNEVASKIYQDPRFLANKCYMIHEGLGVPKNIVYVKKMFLIILPKLKKNKDVYSYFILGWLYQTELLGQRDNAKALLWLKKAQKKGSQEALRYMVYIFYNGGHGVKKNTQKAISLIHQGKQKNPRMMFLLGRYYELQKNNQKSFEWYQKAANKGLPAAIFKLAKSYHHGQGTEKNFHKALKCYKKVAQKGIFGALEKIALFYEKGLGVKPNIKTAIKWYKKAVQKGSTDALKKMAMLYEKGHLEAKVDTKWYQKIAQKKDPLSMLFMADMYKRKKDNDKAFYW